MNQHALGGREKGVMKLKKCWAILLSIVFIMSCLGPNYALADELVLESQSAILIEAHSGKVIYAENAAEQRMPASVTKLMTLVIALEAIENGRGTLTDVVVTSEHAASLGGSQIYLEVGEKMSLQDMLVAIAVGSANDACVAVAEHLYGAEGTFVEKMNEKAVDLGMKGTHFANPYGLPDPEHYTTAADLSLLAQAALAQEGLLELTSIKHYTLRGESAKPFELYNTNKLLWWYPGADGFKTGWVGTESGYCLASTAMKEDLRLIAVVLGAQERYGNFRDAMKLFNYGFANYRYVSFYQPKEQVDTCQIDKGQVREIALGSGEIVGLVVEKNTTRELNTQYTLDEALCAPIQAGDVVGKIEIVQENEVLMAFDLIALESVEKCGFIQQMAWVSKLIYSCS